MIRKLTFLTGFLFVVAALAIYLWFFGKPMQNRENPLQKVDLDKVSRITIKNEFGLAEFERSSDGWVVVLPFRDVMDPAAPTQMIDTLKAFSLGSVVSENASKHSQFQVDPAQAAHIQVFLEKEPKPVLDAYIGKMAVGFNTSYFRFESSTRVYVANDLSEQQFRQEPKRWRLAQVLRGVTSEANAVKIIQEKSILDIARSSNTWTRRGSDKTIDAAMVTPLITKLQNMIASDFGTGTEPADMVGFSKPMVQVSVDIGSRTVSLIVGKRTIPAFPHAPPMRYAKTEGREAIFAIREDAINDLLASIKTIP